MQQELGTMWWAKCCCFHPSRSHAITTLTVAGSRKWSLSSCTAALRVSSPVPGPLHSEATFITAGRSTNSTPHAHTLRMYNRAILTKKSWQSKQPDSVRKTLSSSVSACSRPSSWYGPWWSSLWSCWRRVKSSCSSSAALMYPLNLQRSVKA